MYPHFDLYPGLDDGLAVVPPPPSPRVATPSRIPRKSRKHTHADLYIQVFGRTPPSSPRQRQLPTPPGGAVNPAAISPRQIPRMVSRRRSGTLSQSGSPTPEGSPVRRQLPTPPGGVVSPMALSPGSGRIMSPRQWGLPSSPASTRLPSPSQRPSPLSSPLPVVSEYAVATNTTPTRTSTSQRHVPAQLNLHGSMGYRSSSGSLSASLPGSLVTSPKDTAAGLSRTMSVPPRPLPRARSGSIAVGFSRAPLPPVPDAAPAAVPSYN